ncbi:hypothetical protein DM02DRAFT_603672 [Periconia macrospinosa]|uniref:Amidohydrolase-related domain-containing protein n=1 Tax=Periconia macrospinosa TaxID=97972 RepID=A0A2V1D6I4_9PLEO|nr:hypothetical protein DM02DRAFT_603672 [Periconia macrospinosa]
MASFIIRDIRIFTGEEVIQDGFLQVVNGNIQSVGLSSDTPKDSGKVYSKPGCTLLPGLIDCHVHIGAGSAHALPQALRFGVTTLCEMQSELHHVLDRKKQAQEPDTASYKTAGQAATIENGWPIPVITAHDKSPETLADIAKWPKLTTRESVVEYLDWSIREMQPDYIKLMHESGTSMGLSLSKPTTQLQKHVIEEAQKRGLLTVAHALSLNDTLEVLEAGVNGLTHTMCDQPPTQELVDAYKRNNAWVNPTLATIGSLTAEGVELQKKFAHDPRVQHLLSKNDVEHVCSCMNMAKTHAKVKYAYDSVRMLREAGIDILCGSDSAGPALGTAFGLTMHHELSIFVNEIGMSPEEALRSATSKVAERFRFTDRGKLAQGLNADLLLVEGNPLENIDATLNIRGVWREGTICSTYASAIEA